MAWRHTATSSVLRYPLKAFTEGTDYLQIDMQEYTPVGNKGETRTTTKNVKDKNTGELTDIEITEVTERATFFKGTRERFRKNTRLYSNEERCIFR